VCCVVITQWQWATSMKWHLPLVGVSPVFFLCGEGVCTNSSIVNYSSFWLHLAYSVHSTDMPLLKNRSGKYCDIMFWYITECKSKYWWEAQTYVRYSLNAPLPTQVNTLFFVCFCVALRSVHVNTSLNDVIYWLAFLIQIQAILNEMNFPLLLEYECWDNALNRQ